MPENQTTFDAMLAYCRKRRARLAELLAHPHKHGSRRLEEAEELDAILARVDGPAADPRRDGVDATGQQGGGVG